MTRFIQKILISKPVIALKTVLIVDVITVSKLDGTVVVTEIPLVCSVLGEILLKSTNYKHNPLVGKEELEIEIFITLVLNTDEVREPYYLKIKAEAKDFKRGRTKGTK